MKTYHIAGQRVTTASIQHIFEQIQANPLLSGLHDGNDEFTQREVEDILNLGFSPESRDQIDREDQRAHGQLEGLSARDFRELSSEYLNLFPKSGFPVRYSHLWYLDAKVMDRHGPQEWVDFFDQEFRQYFQFINKVYQNEKGHKYFLSDDGVLRSKMMTKAQELGGEQFQGELGFFFQKLADYRVDPQYIDPRRNAEKLMELFLTAAELSDRYFVPQGFLFNILPLETNSKGRVLAFAYKREGIERVDYFKDSRDFTTRVFHTRAAKFSQTPRDSVHFSAGLTGKFYPWDARKNPVTGGSGPKLDLDAMDGLSRRILNEHQSPSYAYRDFVKKDYPKTPTLEDVKRDYLRLATMHELYHMYLMFRDEALAAEGMKQEVACRLMELAMAPLVWTRLAHTFETAIRRDEKDFDRENIQLIQILADNLGLIKNKEAVVKLTRESQGSEELRVVWNEPLYGALIESLKTMSRLELKSLALKSYHRYIGRPEVWQTTDFNKISEEQF